MRTRVPMLMLVLALMGGEVMFAQSPLPVSAVVSSSTDADISAVRLLVGRSTLVDVGAPITRVSLTSSDVADALVTSPSQLLVHGKTPGTISMLVWDRGGAIRRFEVVVQRDLGRLNDQMKQLFPGEVISVQSNGRDVVLAGKVSSKDLAEKAASVAAGYVEKKEDIVNLLQIGEAKMSTQVLLRVRFAEVSRSALTELGASFFTGPGGWKGNGNLGQATTQQFPAPSYDPLLKGAAGPGDGPVKQTFSDFLNLFLFSNKYNVGTVITALQQRGLFQSLAEPNLIADNGKEASFLAGGEIPVPVVQGGGNYSAVTVQWKEFGIRLNFTPTVSGKTITLKVKPEVSTLDFANAIVLQGFRIPALSTRRTETEVQLTDGQTFAIAGLLSNQVSSTLRKMPGIGDIPILGLLFTSKAAQKDQTELVVMITPQILGADSPGVTAEEPRVTEPFLAPPADKKLLTLPPPAFVPAKPADADASPAPMPSANIVPVAKPQVASPAAAAATMSALTPSGRKVVHQPASGPAAAQDQPAASPNQPAAAQTAAVSHPLTAEETKALERARKEEREKKAADDRAREAEARRNAKLAEEERRRTAKAEAEAQKLAREQARQDAAAAKKAAEVAARQAELDRKQQKVIEEAAAKLKAAEAAYQAEVAKKNKAATQQQ